MEFPMQFIRAGKAYCSLERQVPAPYLRKAFRLEKKPSAAELMICGLGFYELYLNGERLTKGPLAPYISAPDDLIYYDSYEVSEFLKEGENAVTVLLGNGMQNSFGGYVWDFEKAKWRGAPQMALRLEGHFAGGPELILESGTDFKAAPSPILLDELRCGEIYDARKEIPGVTEADFDDSAWVQAEEAPMPRGVPRLCSAPPIIISEERAPVEIIPYQEGFVYDFGENLAGVCRMRIDGQAGQQVTLRYGELLEEGVPSFSNIYFHRLEKEMVQECYYTCREGGQVYTPAFTYFGFRYVYVTGITKQQATASLLTFLVMHSELGERGEFTCSEPILNKLQRCTKNSTRANFYYFPTDCPHREKNGWTADAALSAEHMLLNFSPEESYRQWLESIREAQRADGALPGIVPTGGWGFDWGNGPAWDAVLIDLPYFTWLYRGDKKILRENACAIFRYLYYLNQSLDNDGLLALGLGDWCAPEGCEPEAIKAPLVVTDSIISMEIARKAARIYEVLEMEAEREYADSLYRRLRCQIRRRLIDFRTMIVAGNCQTSQAMAIYYDVFEAGEKEKAFRHLKKLIEKKEYHMDVGVLGGRVIFHVLSGFGDCETAYRMIMNPTNPSYAEWIARGATSLWEDFEPAGGAVHSHNHHFWGDISAWFYRELAGIHINPFERDYKEVDIRPQFPERLNFVKASHRIDWEELAVSWERKQDKICLTIEAPEFVHGRIILPDGYAFAGGVCYKKLASGIYELQKM